MLISAARVPNWTERFLDYVASRECMPYAWWLQDCATFARGIVMAVIDRDPMADVPPYRTAEEAGRLLNKPLEDWLDERFKRGAKGLARRGDLGVVEIERRRSIVVFDYEFVIGPGEHGLVRLPRGHAEDCWLVG